mgnify:CR=1 FL=1
MKELRDTLFYLSGEYHSIHLLICRYITTDPQSEEDYKEIMARLKHARQIVVNLTGE